MDHGLTISMLHRICRHFNKTTCQLIGTRQRIPNSLPGRRIAIRSNSRTSSAHGDTNIIFSGIQSTGVPHLGNYLGALSHWVALQNHAAEKDQFLYSVVDLHAITIPQDAHQLRMWRRETLATLLAVGLNPERCTIFYQSAVPEHTEMMWILSCMAPMGYLSRMTQWKVWPFHFDSSGPVLKFGNADCAQSKLALSDDASLLDPNSTSAKARLGLFSYPVLQAADIVLYGTTHVPVGEDQVQHLEFTRNCVDVFNARHGDVLVKPRVLLCQFFPLVHWTSNGG